MGDLHFPLQYTEEEEMLQKKYQKLKRKKKALQQLKAPKQEPPPVQFPLKCTPEAKQNAKEVAKKLLKSGAISAIKVENKERQGFKRTKTLERRRSGTERSGVAGYQPFSASHSIEEENADAVGAGNSRPAIKSLYDSFVSARETEEQDGRTEREAETERPRQGNTTYVHGYGVTEDILRSGFAPFGNIINISMEIDKNCGFVTFEKMESAEKAIHEMNNSTVSNVKLKVSLSRRQPFISTPVEGAPASSASWSTIAASTSQKGSHKDKRELVAYDDNLF